MREPKLGNGGLQLLIVDDSEDDMILTCEALAGTEHLRVGHRARSGEEALAYLRREGPFKKAARPSMVLLDVNMHGMSGMEVLRAIKTDPNISAIPVVVLTVSGREEDISRAYAVGASSYLRKPLSFPDLLLAFKHFETYWTQIARVPGVKP